jgi:F-type H+-transporting ATPase subunit b
MPQFDPSSFASQIFWLAVTFVALYLVMSRVVVPRIAEVLDTRRRRIETNLEKAEAVKKDAAQALATYEKAIDAAREEARGLIAEAGQRIAETAARQEAELIKNLARQVAESEAGIARAVDAAMGGVRQAAAEAAVDAAERLIGERIERAEAERAVDAALSSAPRAEDRPKSRA